MVNYWHKQSSSTPLYPDLLWSRPENKHHAGRLLIVGGNLHGFAAPGTAYGAALKAGIGAARVLLPDKLQKTVGKFMPEAEFAPSTPSGSFARLSLAKLLADTNWADGVLLAGDFGHNSETVILLESFAQKYEGLLTLAGDSLDHFLDHDAMTLRRHSVMIINLDKLQKLAKNNRPGTPILHSMNLHELVTVLSDWTNSTPVSFITMHANNFIVASGGQVSTTPVSEESNWQTELAAYTSVWWLQQPHKAFEALTTAVFEYTK